MRKLSALSDYQISGIIDRSIFTFTPDEKFTWTRQNESCQNKTRYANCNTHKNTTLNWLGRNLGNNHSVQFVHWFLALKHPSAPPLSVIITPKIRGAGLDHVDPYLRRSTVVIITPITSPVLVVPSIRSRIVWTNVRLRHQSDRRFYAGRSGCRLTFNSLGRSAVMEWELLPEHAERVHHKPTMSDRWKFHHTVAACDYLIISVKLRGFCFFDSLHRHKAEPSGLTRMRVIYDEYFLDLVDRLVHKTAGHTLPNLTKMASSPFLSVLWFRKERESHCATIGRTWAVWNGKAKHRPYECDRREHWCYGTAAKPGNRNSANKSTSSTTLPSKGAFPIVTSVECWYHLKE